MESLSISLKAIHRAVYNRKLLGHPLRDGLFIDLLCSPIGMNYCVEILNFVPASPTKTIDPPTGSSTLSLPPMTLK
ncbi:hypothetical protein D3C87_1866130 [compost metagenome]